MPQLNFTPARGLAGTIVLVEPEDRFSVLNPLRAQTAVADVNGATDNGAYRLQAIDTQSGATYTHAAITATGLTAAQIAAALVTAWNGDPLARKFGVASVINTDQVAIARLQANRAFTLSWAEDVSGDGLILANTVEPGYDVVKPGIILSADGAGGFTRTFTSGTLALGVVFRGANLYNFPENPNGEIGYRAGMLPVARKGTVQVDVAAGVSVIKRQRAYFNGTTGTWSNASTGSHVLVPGSFWESSGTGVQDVYFNLPTET